MKLFLDELVNRITLNKILTATAIFLAVMIAGTTIAVFSQNNKVPYVTAEPQAPLKPVNFSYKELGRMRAVTLSEKGKNGITVVINPLLAYTKDDADFYEELSRKNAQIKSIFINYFSGKTRAALKAKSDTEIKNELLSELNEILVLNKIQDIYFEDFIFLD